MRCNGVHTALIRQEIPDSNSGARTMVPYSVIGNTTDFESVFLRSNRSKAALGSISNM